MPDEKKDEKKVAVATMGSPVAPATGAPQTTIDTKTTTILPNTSILNPVEPDGQPAPEHIKRATTDQTNIQPVKFESKEPATAAPLTTTVVEAPKVATPLTKVVEDKKK